ncbi:phospholipase effector Tle1 domain-containing protein [Pseudomonas chlororaphis subsp. aurantiaca]|uniref:phospholipase effector Tle1 domain-containing protein n=1 Tax=Pseudomonas chlororaphis TaxID=587753 RepID=UPI00398BAACB
MASNGPGPMPNLLRPANPNQRPAERAAETEQPSYGEQLWAQYEKYAKEPAPPPEKVQVTLRIGVFFDGTGNNASNSAMGQICGAQNPIEARDIDGSCKPYMRDPESSYGNDVSNVKRLSDLYYSEQESEGEGLQRQAFRTIYIEGIGTQAGEKDSVITSGTGRGGTGISGCVQKAFIEIKQRLGIFFEQNPDSEITSLTFDAFGFSRGAAAARHFANEVVRWLGPLELILHDHSKAFSPRFNRQYGNDLDMGFIGLFDTVPSVAGLSNLGNVRSAIAPGIKLHLDRRYFRSVVQLVARDEYRANFALSRVKPDHVEITLPGAHSDIGGGYLDEVQECVLVSPMQALEVPFNTDVTHTSIYREAIQTRKRWLAEGWPAQWLEIVTPKPMVLPQDSQDRLGLRQKRVYVGVQLKRPMSNKLSRVCLRVMYELAKQHGVRFQDIPDIPEHEIPTELQSLCDRFVAGDYSTTPTEETMLKLRYIHLSAHWNHPLGKQDGGSLKVVYINAPTVDAVRVQHPHVPDWTLW